MITPHFGREIDLDRHKWKVSERIRAIILNELIKANQPVRRNALLSRLRIGKDALGIGLRSLEKEDHVIRIKHSRKNVTYEMNPRSPEVKEMLALRERIDDDSGSRLEGAKRIMDAGNLRQRPGESADMRRRRVSEWAYLIAELAARTAVEKTFKVADVEAGTSKVGPLVRWMLEARFDDLMRIWSQRLVSLYLEDSEATDRGYEKWFLDRNRRWLLKNKRQRALLLEISRMIGY